jgi:hypothetical protein
VLKVALLFSAMHSLDKRVESSHVAMAIEWLQELTPDVKTVLGGGGRNDLAPTIYAVLQYIKDQFALTSNPVNKKLILLKFRSAAKDEELALVLQHLVSTEEIVADLHGTQITYKPKV